MDTTIRYIANSVVSFGDEGDEGAVLFNPDIDDVIFINPTGKVIWQFIDSPRTVEQIAEHLAELFRIPSPDNVTKDVKTFIQLLLPDFVNEIEANHET